MSTPFKVDLDDLEFVFFDQLKVDEKLGATEAYGDFDRDTYRATLQEIRKVAEDVLHPINASGDREGCTLDGDGNVTTPKGYKNAWRQMAEGGWIAPAAAPELGGAGMPRSISGICNDVFPSACVAFLMYPGLTAAAARVAALYAPEQLRTMVATKLFSGDWGGTMCLTESGAGSSVGDNRCKATPDAEDGMWQLEGEKIFISGGDQDLTENIVHLVLARTPGAPEGTKGLSLFLVPKFMFDAEGNLGERNGAKVVGIEHKMGINGSATCTIALGADRPCRAWMVGEERQGIALMFRMMNEARIGVALQGVSTCNAAYGYAVRYATDRIQGQSLRHLRDPEAKNVAIVEHPDVRRMLLTLQVIAATTRSACYKIALWTDLAQTTSDETQRNALEERMDLLIPVLKAHCTDLAFEMASTAVQVYGGYGFIGEYPVEQLLRDSKIQAIYEGTNGIQALDLLGRKMRLKGGALFMAWMADAQKDLKLAAEAGLTAQSEAIGKALGHLGAAAMHLGKLAGGGRIEGAFVQAVPFLKTFGVVLLAMEALEQARVAQALIAERGATPLLRRKVVGLDFYVAHLLPQATALAKTVQSGDESPMDPDLFVV
jgi:alkylation response protein AidB-like acyl-CoA dehydrogenase